MAGGRYSCRPTWRLEDYKSVRLEACLTVTDDILSALEQAGKRSTPLYIVRRVEGDELKRQLQCSGTCSNVILSQSDTFVEAQALFAAGPKIARFQRRDGGAKVAAKCLRRSGMIAALLFAPLAPALEERAGLDDRGNPWRISPRRADRHFHGNRLLQTLDRFGRAYGRATRDRS